mmetsp:Transcript_36248/g.59556  ORF Transcript_36248/g.59556 Transcript_36248/m.59556 type:complete len:85 (-) Transcript_36248:2931-3185(-)
MIRSNACCTKYSLSESNAEVASSNNKIAGRLSKARAMAILCRCPPLSLPPNSPTDVSYPFSNLSINSSAFACFAASRISSIVAA